MKPFLSFVPVHLCKAWESFITVTKSIVSIGLLQLSKVRESFSTVTMSIVSLGLVHIYKVWEIKTLGKSRDAEARKLLEDLAKQVQPIMMKHKWRVGVLSEFCPIDPCIFGLNCGGGTIIRIRLRKPNRETEFLPYESLLGTMLHELTHNEHGAHDAQFHKLLDEITNECKELTAKGISPRKTFDCKSSS